MDSKRAHTGILSILICLILFVNFAPPASAAGDKKCLYIKNSTRPEHLYVIEQNNMTDAENTMIATLQGIASKSKLQIYTLNRNQPSYRVWLEDLKKNHGVEYEFVKDPWCLVDKFKHLVSGYVLYDSKKPGDPSINNACSLAALKNSIAVDKSLEETVKKHGVSKLQGDCRNTDKYWGYRKLWNSGINHSTVIQLNPKRSSALRDYAIMTKSLIFYEDEKDSSRLRDSIFGSMPENSICLGWGPDEFKNISLASKHDIITIPADWSCNLTVLSAFPSCPLRQKSAKDAEENLPKKNAHYVTFIMSDGDNQQWNLGSNFSSPKWYGSKYRGKLSMGWSISPSLYYMAPTVLGMYYKNASSKTFRDNFIVSPSGMGYIYPSRFHRKALDSYINILDKYMEKADQKYVCILDDKSFYNRNIWDRYTRKSNIKGLFYLDYSRQDSYKGKIIWSNGKPVASCRNLLWSGIEDEGSLVKNITDYVEKGFTDPKKENAYTVVYVHAWSKNLENVYRVQKELEKNPKIKIVAPDIFMETLQRNL
ncbi:GxGYxYP domain-containing protein [Clostridium sp. LBM24168]